MGHTLALVTIATMMALNAEAAAQTAPISLPDLIAKGGQVKAAVQGPSVVGVASNNLYVEHQKKLYVCRVAFWAGMHGNPVRAASDDADVNMCWAIE